MPKISDARDQTILAATKLFRLHGYNGASLQDILKAAGSPRGSLYFHFPGGKEEIGAAALAFYAEAVRRMMAVAAENSQTAEGFLGLILQNMAADLERTEFKEGCPIAAVAAETAGQSEVLGEATRKAFQAWEREIKAGLERFGLDSEFAASTATAALSQLEGALLLARTYRSLAPLRRAEKVLRLLARPRDRG
jgi:TetR/AcrR family transcriptional repressor of lmrAB and yxaGH operons